MPHRLRSLLESSGTSFTVAEFPSGAVLFRQGDDCHDAWCIEAGRVRLTVTSADGREAVLGPLGAGSLINDDLLAGHQEFRHSAVAIEPTVVVRVPGDQMSALLYTHPDVLDHIIAQVMAQNTQLEEALVDQLLCPSEERLAHALLLLAQCDGTVGCCPLPRVSQEVLAAMVGTTRSRVNVFMGRFKKVGFIETKNGGLYVKSAALSRAIHHGVAKQRVS